MASLGNVLSADWGITMSVARKEVKMSKQDLSKVFTDYWKGDVIDVPRAMEYLEALFKSELQQLKSEMPEKQSLDNLDPNEKINRREYAEWTMGYNQALTEVLAVIDKAIKEDK